MELAQRLNAIKNIKVLEFATEFAKKIEPRLVDSAQKGYKSLKYTIDPNIQEEKDNLQCFIDPLFVGVLNENLGGVKVRYQKEYIENPIFKNIGYHKHHLVFDWSETGGANDE